MSSKLAHDAWKSLNSKIHPLLPLTARTSQQLLSLLNASFKQQLDRQHPAASLSTEDHASHHLHSILTDPLFNNIPRTHETSTGRKQPIGQFLGQRQGHRTKYMDIFKERVSQGRANLMTAKFCLSMQYKACRISALTTREAMQVSGAASTILQWLWSSGIEDKGEFLNDPIFVDFLIAFLVAEGQQSRISTWLQRCRSSGRNPFLGLSGMQTDRMRYSLFAKLIREEIRHGGGVDSAIKSFIRTVADLRSSGLNRQAIGHDAKNAVWKLLEHILRLPKSVEPQPALLDAFSKTTRDIISDTHLKASLCLYIEKPPDPQPAIEFFQTISAQAIEYTPASHRRQMIFLGLRAAKLLIQDDRQTEALLIMKSLQNNFARDLGSPSPHSRTPPKWESLSSLRDEERTLSLLDTLPI